MGVRVRMVRPRYNVYIGDIHLYVALFWYKIIPSGTQ